MLSGDTCGVQRDAAPESLYRVVSEIHIKTYDIAEP